MLLRDREMPAEIQYGDGTHLPPVPLGMGEAPRLKRQGEAMGKVGFAGGGAAGLSATDVHAATLPRQAWGRKRAPQILWLYFLGNKRPIYIFQ